MLEDLTSKLNSVFKKITGQGKLTENNISDALREIRRALLDADVNYKVAKKFIDDVSQKALGKEVINSLSPSQLITKILYDELTNLLGGTNSELKINASGLTTILNIGLQGSGKTTFSGKLAKYLSLKNIKVLLVAADVYRPAAIEQLRKIGDSIGVPVFYRNDDLSVIDIVKSSLSYAKEKSFNTAIIDTAGRLHIDEDMMAEAKSLKELVNPTETLFIVDSMTGQDAVNSAKSFNDKVGFDGVVLTKLDGDSRGGCALSIKAIVEKPIKFIGVGETPDSIEAFHPDRLASRILGKGDLMSLVEKAQQEIDKEEAGKFAEKFKKNQFDFEDFLKQLRMIKKMGSLKSILEMLPGIGSNLQNAEIDDKQLVKIEAIIQSMTLKERESPKIINGGRRARIAKGSGTSVQDVNRLLRQFAETQKMMKAINQKLPKGFFRN